MVKCYVYPESLLIAFVKTTRTKKNSILWIVLLSTGRPEIVEHDAKILSYIALKRLSKMHLAAMTTTEQGNVKL